MLSSLNSFSGLSAAELLKLFAANSSSSSSASSASKNTDQWAAIGVSGSSANDPAKAIQAILVQAQIEQAQIAQGQVQVEQAQTQIWTAGPAVVVKAEAAYTEQALGGSPFHVTAESACEATGRVNASGQAIGGVGYLVSTDFTSASSASASIDNFQATVAVGTDSITVGFALAGLGKLQLDPSAGGYSVGQGHLADFFQIDVSAAGQCVGIAFNIFGLDATQAQQLAAVYQDATSAPNNIGSATNTGFDYTKCYGPDFSVNYAGVIGYGPFPSGCG